jgi:16S rRNA G966 N2-methylase RsmD
LAITTISIEQVKTTKYADKVSPLSKEDYEILKQSIRDRGFLSQYPIILNQNGDVLDGHHRLQACKELNIDPYFETMQQFANDLQEQLFVIDCNLARRQLTPFNRAKLVLQKDPILAELAQQQMKAGTPLSRDQERVHVDERLAIEAKTSKDTIHKARQLIQAASDHPDKKLGLGPRDSNRTYAELLRDVQRDKTPLNKAYKLIRRDQELIQARRETEQAAKGLSLPSRVTLLNADSTDPKTWDHHQLQDGSIDLIITDPPYTKEATAEAFKGLARLADQKLKPGGSVVFYFGQHQIFDIGKIFADNAPSLKYWWMFAVKNHSSATAASAVFHTRGVRVHWKPMLWYVKGDRRMLDRHVFDFIQSEKPDKTQHHWAQSQVEAEYIISTLTVSENSLVVDPFLGSGAFAIPAAKLGRYFIGVEKDKETYERARNYIIKETQSNNNDTQQQQQ